MKVIIRSTLSKYKGIGRLELEEEIATLEMSLNNIKSLKQKVILNKESNSISYNEPYISRVKKIKVAEISIQNDLELSRKKLEKSKTFKNSAKWFEYGEKLNKFFLNINKFRAKQKLIANIKNGEREYSGQTEVMEGIREFYCELYKKENLPDNQDEDFYKLCPNLSKSNKIKLDNVISLEEMEKALKSCKELSPGPDGIPYKVYKIFWKEVGSIVKESWDYSVSIGELPKSHKESAIVIIPKEGKDINDIKNWRPITLSNCDAKIITKSLAMRLNPILETIIDPSQTAYVPGRSVMDNIRCNRFLKDYCRDNKVKAVLTSLDAKKAFDSVDHVYIDKILAKYGFGIMFRKYFKTIYRDISAKILVNGYFTESINITRGVKQGDALSCAIFILCIDPLLRNINNNSKIIPVKIPNLTNNIKFEKAHKASGFADDVSVICVDDGISLKQIFREYQRLTDKSGLTLNAEKTEILTLHPNILTKVFPIEYDKQTLTITSVLSLKICGIYFCKDLNEEYEMNVNKKINKLVGNLKIWSSRNLTFEGRSLILKTFGISQLIYNMQCTLFEKSQLKEIERYKFNFIWGTKDIFSSRARDRIKRSEMKNEYELGCLKITDIESLDRSLKLRQFIRASKSNHVIRQVQNYCINKMLSNDILISEFGTISKKEAICGSAQDSINIITDTCRQNRFLEQGDSIESKYAIEQISMTNVDTYLTRKSRVFLKCIYKSFEKKGIITFLDLVREAETEMDTNISKRLEAIIHAFPTYFRDAANSFNDDINSQNQVLTHIQSNDGKWLPIYEVTTKELQTIFKSCLNKTTLTNFQDKLGFDPGESIDVERFRKGCKNTKLRHIHFRLIHNDFYTHSKMFKYKMNDSPYCPRCGSEETTKHLLWECEDSKKIWTLFNVILSNNQLSENKILKYEDLYRTEYSSSVSIIKMKIIQAMIQIERPKNWCRTNLVNLIVQIRDFELLNSTGSTDPLKTRNKWKNFLNLLN
jgi:hypothetical protein